MDHLNAFYLRWKCAACQGVHTRKVPPDEKGYLYEQNNHHLQLGMTAAVQPYDAVMMFTQRVDLSCEADEARVEGEQ
jgi:hypothetical protein